MEIKLVSFGFPDSFIAGLNIRWSDGLGLLYKGMQKGMPDHLKDLGEPRYMKAW